MKDIYVPPHIYMYSSCMYVTPLFNVTPIVPLALVFLYPMPSQACVSIGPIIYCPAGQVGGWEEPWPDLICEPWNRPYPLCPLPALVYYKHAHAFVGRWWDRWWDRTRVGLFEPCIADTCLPPATCPPPLIELDMPPIYL